MTRCFLVVIAGLFAALVAGCARQRPAAGDTVFPIVHCPKTWQAGQSVVMQVKLGVQSEQEKPELLRFEQLPETPDLRANITFYKGDDVIATENDIALVPDC